MSKPIILASVANYKKKVQKIGSTSSLELQAELKTSFVLFVFFIGKHLLILRLKKALVNGSNYPTYFRHGLLKGAFSFPCRSQV